MLDHDSQAAARPRRIWIDRTSELPAPVQDVEALLCDVDGWPSWTPGLRSIRRSGAQPVRQGTRFTMVLQLAGLVVPLPCQVLRMEPGLIEWGGGFAGGMIRHSFAYEATEAGGCRVRHLEYATGWLGLLSRPFEGAALAHDSGWSDALEARFA